MWQNRPEFLKWPVEEWPKDGLKSKGVENFKKFETLGLG